MTDTPETMVIDFNCALEVGYERDEDPSEGRINPVDLKFAKLRGKDLLNIMHIGHIMTLQRQIFNRLLDDEFAAEGEGS